MTDEVNDIVLAREHAGYPRWGDKEGPRQGEGEKETKTMKSHSE